MGNPIAGGISAEAVDRHRAWFFGLGVALIVLGVIAISVPMVATLAAELLVGWVLVLGGVAQVIHAFRARQWRGFLLGVLIGALYLFAGVMLLVFPMAGVLTLTLVLAAFLAAEGVFKIIMGSQLRPAPGSGWLVFSGVLALVLAVLIWIRWPSSAVWVIGLLIGIDLLFGGWTMVMMAIAARNARGSAAAA